jgi:hypothetical protein
VYRAGLYAPPPGTGNRALWPRQYGGNAESLDSLQRLLVHTGQDLPH